LARLFASGWPQLNIVSRITSGIAKVTLSDRTAKLPKSACF
jgi:hypothetical protein